jgi:UPF0176 protein
VIAVVTFYKFVELSALEDLRASIENRAAQLDLRGTVLLAHEGINGTLCGAAQALESLSAWLHEQPPFADLVCKYSQADADNPVFHRLKIRIKPEIVNMGMAGLPISQRTGTHVGPQRWHKLLEDPDVVVIDTRNDYEVAIGTFPGAVNPRTRSFREFPDFVRENLDPQQHRRVAMFCTGGVRCEKASTYMLEQGFEEVFQLDGGILNYLEQVSDQDNHWAGECFVFDQRVSVDDSLQQGTFTQCFACRRALSEADLASPAYQRGISCPHCADELNEQQKASFAERAKQEALALERGERHIGATMQAPAVVKSARENTRG